MTSLEKIGSTVDLLFRILFEAFPAETVVATNRLLDETRAEYGAQLLADLDLDVAEDGDDD